VNAESITVVTTIVVLLVQMLKWFRVIEDRRGPIAVLGLSLVGVVIYGVSQEPSFERTDLWPYFSAWIVVAASAAGVYGFTRSLPESITSTAPTRPPSGAMAEPVAKV
jgi:hypothetical protein